MKNEDLKKQFDEIERKIEAGEVVQINFSEGGKTVSLEANAEGTREASAKTAAPEDDIYESAGDESPMQTFNLNLTESDISDGEIADIISKVEPSIFESTGDVPDVVLRRPGNNWVLFEECSYNTNLGYKITAPKDYETDLASIPRVFWTLVSSFELSLAAPLFHDLLYRCGGVLPGNQLDPNDGKKFKRKEADLIFLELMEKADITKWKREAAYYAVRGFSGFAWKD